MRIFTTPSFDRDLRGSELGNGELQAAVGEIEAGLIDANLGGELLKKRVARPGGGKSGGYRVVLAYRQGERVIFMHLFAKNEKSSVTKSELAALKIGQGLYVVVCRGIVRSRFQTGLTRGEIRCPGFFGMLEMTPKLCLTPD